MPPIKCAPDCAKARERRKRAYEKSENVRSYYRNGNRRLSSDHEISDSTDYQSLPERRSISSCESDQSGESIHHDETSSSSKSTLEKLSMSISRQNNCLYTSQKLRRENYHRNEQSRESRREKLYFSEDPGMKSRSKANEHRINRGAKYEDCSRRACPNEDCSRRKSSILFSQRRRSSLEGSYSESQIQSDQSESESLSCPQLCSHDPLRIPTPKMTCESSCKKQIWLDKQREKRQMQIDRYILNKGLNYFEDLCHCSLKCLVTQICMDPFVKKTAASAAFFFLGIKLCFELDAWYIPF